MAIATVGLSIVVYVSSLLPSARLEAMFNKIDRRFDKIDAKFEKLDAKFGSRFDEIQSSLNYSSNLTVQLAGIISIIAILFLIFVEVIRTMKTA